MDLPFLGDDSLPASSATYCAGDLVGTGIVNGGWSGTTTIDVPVKGMGHIYNHKSIHVHIFPITG